MKRALVALALALLLPSLAFAAPRNISDDTPNAAALNINFSELYRWLSNAVTKTGTQTITGAKTFSGSVAFSTITAVSSFTATTGRFSGVLTAATLDTGQGTNELYDMNQNVQTSDDVQFNSLGIGTTPSQPFQVFKNQSSVVRAQFRASNTTGGQERRFFLQVQGNGTGDEVALIAGQDSAGNRHQMITGDTMLQLAVGAGTQALIEGDGDFHIQPSGTADVELEVSNGASTGGGTIHRASSATHSRRALKHSIAYYTAADYRAAYNDLKTLRHVTFKYKTHKSTSSAELVDNPAAPIHKGLIYEEVPDRIKDGSGAIVVDDRIQMLEMALIEAIKKIEALENELAR